MLEQGMRMEKDKGNHQDFVMSLVNVKNNFSNIYLIHANLMIDRVEANFSKELSTLELIQMDIND